VSEAGSSTPWWIVVVLSAVVVYTIFGMVGSFISSRSADGTNEDQHWFFGFYNNPDDYDLFVKNRYIPRLTVNLGRPMGKALMFLSLLLFVVLDVLVVVTSLS
jgi:uncharacterized membrane protein